MRYSRVISLSDVVLDLCQVASRSPFSTPRAVHLSLFVPVRILDIQQSILINDHDTLTQQHRPTRI